MFARFCVAGMAVPLSYALLAHRLARNSAAPLSEGNAEPFRRGRWRDASGPNHGFRGNPLAGDHDSL